jgi:hypothetical protein
MANKKSTVVKEKSPIKAKKKIGREELIEVMSFTNGEVIYINPRTREEYIWGEFGDVKLIPFSELIEMKSRYPKFLMQPWLLILNDEVIEHFGLKDFYKTLVRPEEIDAFYKMGDAEMVKFIQNTTKDMRSLIVNQTRQKIRNKEFGDLFKIRLIESTINEINTKNNKNSLLQISLIDEE